MAKVRGSVNVHPQLLQLLLPFLFLFLESFLHRAHICILLILWGFRKSNSIFWNLFSHAKITDYISFTVKAVAVQNTTGFIEIRPTENNWSGFSQIENDVAMDHPKLSSTVFQTRKWGQIFWICVACPFISSSEILFQYINCTYGD